MCSFLFHKTCMIVKEKEVGLEISLKRMDLLMKRLGSKLLVM